MTEELKEIGTETKHEWDIRKCIWCGKPHVKYPITCAKSVAKLVKKYGRQRPVWVQQLIQDANHYLDSFRSHFR